MRSILLSTIMILAAIPSSARDLIMQGERHLKNMRQLTLGGENAEAYFSGDDKLIIFQSTRGEHDCDQIYTMAVDGNGPPAD